MGGAYVMPLARDLPKERLSTYSIRWAGRVWGWGQWVGLMLRMYMHWPRMAKVSHNPYGRSFSVRPAS